MRTLEIAGKSVNVDIENLSKELYEKHAADPKILAILKFGMLYASIIETFETEFKENIKRQFSEMINDSHAAQINSFIKATKTEIIHGIYKHAKMHV